MSDDPDLVEGKFKAIKHEDEEHEHEDEAHAEEDEEDEEPRHKVIFSNWDGAQILEELFGKLRRENRREDRHRKSSRRHQDDSEDEE